MFENPVKQRLLEGKACLGTWTLFGSTIAAEMLASYGFEFVVVDLEHFPIGVETAVHQYQAITAGGSVPIARLAKGEHVHIKRALDGGAMGIIVPLIETADDARCVVDSSRFPPAGRRPYGAGRIVVHGVEYLSRANDEILVMLQIERREAVDNLDEILAVEGYDGCFIGPTDLALSLGMPTPLQGGCQELEDLVSDLARRILAAGKLLGTVTQSPEVWRQRVEQGFQLVSLLGDLGYMRSGMQAALRDLESHGHWPRTGKG